MGFVNLAMLKISFDFSGVDAGIQSIINGVRRDTVGCAPLTVDFIDTIANAVTYYWYFGDGSSPNPAITTTPNITHTYNLPGIYPVQRDHLQIHLSPGILVTIPQR